MDAEIYKTEGKEVDFDYLNMDFDKIGTKKIISGPAKSDTRKPDVVYEEFKFNVTMDKMQQISEEVMEQRQALF